MPLIAGLGNPGAKYAGTRHNAGFELIEELQQAYNARLSSGKGPFETAKIIIGDLDVYLIKPTTFINNSGDAVQQALNWYKETPENCLICYDDLNLDVGKLRLRPGGSAGGHNGMKDIIQKAGTNKIPRLRIGIGNDFKGGQQINYVLSKFNKDQRKIMDATIKKSADAVETFFQEGPEQAMNDFN